MKRMTPATKLIFSVLKGKYKYYSERRMLADDGSFYCIDQVLMEFLGIADNTIRRARIFLKEAGEINYAIGKHKGAATRYWIIPKGAKMEPFGQGVKEAKMAPFEQDREGAKMSAKEANLVVKGSQNVTLNNNEVNNEDNKNMPDNSSFTEEEKEGIRAFAKSYGTSRISHLLADKGYDPVSIEQILEGIEG